MTNSAGSGSPDFDHTTGLVPPNLAVKYSTTTLPFKSQTLVNPCYEASALRCSSHLERHLRAGYARGL